MAPTKNLLRGCKIFYRFDRPEDGGYGYEYNLDNPVGCLTVFAVFQAFSLTKPRFLHGSCSETEVSKQL
jgi:hypothetical protein